MVSKLYFKRAFFFQPVVDSVGTGFSAQALHHRRDCRLALQALLPPVPSSPVWWGYPDWPARSFRRGTRQVFSSLSSLLPRELNCWLNWRCCSTIAGPGRPVTILKRSWTVEYCENTIESFGDLQLLLLRLLLTALLLLLLLVIISNSSRSEAGEVIAPTGDGRCAGSCKKNSNSGETIHKKTKSNSPGKLHLPLVPMDLAWLDLS